MKLWRWEEGRQGTGYSKFTLLFSKQLKCDAYILKIPKGTAIPPHTDPVPNAKHHRVNITLRGEIWMFHSQPFKQSENKIFRIGGWFSYFRPDVVEHAAAPVPRDTYLLSFGWLT